MDNSVLNVLKATIQINFKLIKHIHRGITGENKDVWKNKSIYCPTFCSVPFERTTIKKLQFIVQLRLHT